MEYKTLLTKNEAAKMLRISPRTLDTARAQRGLPYITLPGCRKILFDEQELLDWVQANSVVNVYPKEKTQPEE